MAEDVNSESIYFNTRVAGLRSKLFGRVQIEELLEHGDVQRMIDTLLDSDYRKDMAESLTRFSGAYAVEDAVSRNLASTFHNLVLRAGGELKERVRFFLGRWDLAAAKSVLRVKHHNLQGENAESMLVPGATLTVARLREMAQADTMETLVSLLIGWNPQLCRGLRGALTAYREKNDLNVLEETLDRAYYVNGVSRLQQSDDDDAQLLREQLQSEIDRINLRLVFLRVQDAISQEDFNERLLPKGSLGHELLKRMAAAGDPAGAVALLAGTRYASLVEELFPVLQTGRYSGMERFLDRLFMKQTRRFARRDVFGIGVLMDYAWRKYNETVNLRLVARGLAGGLPAGRVRDELYFA